MATKKQLSFLITGAGRSIGRGLSRLLLSKRHRVFLIDNNADELDHIIHRLAKEYPGQSSFFQARIIDLCKPDAIREVSQELAEFFDKGLDCLTNNAAVTGAVGAHDFAELPLEVWNQSLAANLTPPMLLSQLLLPQLKNAKGSIINISSTRAHQSEPNSESYAATKAGLLGLTHSMACSLSNTGVRANAILPGWINVADECKEADGKGIKWEDGLSEEDHRWHWTGRVGKVDDVLKAVEYLVDAEFVTGQEFVVDGGVTKKMVYNE